MSTEISIKLRHLNKFMKRTDIKNLHWFAFEVDFFKHPDFKKITPQEKLMFLDIIGICVSLKKDVVRLDLEYMDFEYHHPKGTCLNTIKKLEGKQWDIVSRTESEQIRTDPCPTGQDSTLQDSTLQDSTLMSSGDDQTLPLWVELWNEHCGKLPKVQKVSKERQKKIYSLMKEFSSEEIVKVIQKAEASEFCNGKNDQGWVLTFDFILKAENCLKVLEGKYDNRTKHIASRASKISDNLKRLREKIENETEEREVSFETSKTNPFDAR